MITLTDWKTREPVMLDSKEIGAIKRIISEGEGNICYGRIKYKGQILHSAIFIISDSGMYDHRIDVCETPEEISELIMAPLLEAGEQIRI